MTLTLFVRVRTLLPKPIINPLRSRISLALQAIFPMLLDFKNVSDASRVSRILRTLRGTRRVDNGCVHDRAALHHMAGGHHHAVDGVEEQLVQDLFFFSRRRNLQSVVSSGTFYVMKSMPVNLRMA